MNVYFQNGSLFRSVEFLLDEGKLFSRPCFQKGFAVLVGFFFPISNIKNADAMIYLSKKRATLERSFFPP